MGGCAFCRVYREKKDVFYEDEHFFAQFDPFPVLPGHAEVMPKRHIASLFELDDKERLRLVSAVEDVKGIIERTNLKKIYTKMLKSPLNEKSKYFCEEALKHPGLGKRPDGYTIGVNEGEAAGRTVPHLHIHIIPRYKGDVDDPTGGIRHIISGKGNYRR
jgi:histidine triad (HIT) family protein